MAFLTDLDSRAAVKGSRDPLGLVPVWSRFGRRVVGNLTTVSNSVRGFTTLLLGYYFAEAVRQSDPSQSTLEIVLKFEQLAGYARSFVNHDNDFRGRERVVARLAKSSKASIGMDAGSQILSNQKIYGLWGLFSGPAKESGLLISEERVLTSEAREFVEKNYISRLTRDGLRAGKPIIELLKRDQAEVHLAGRDASLARSIAAIHSPDLTSAEREFYDRHLVDGGSVDNTAGCQPLLGDLLAGLDAAAFGTAELQKVTRKASRQAGGQALADHLERIARVEALLVPMANAFAFLLTRHRQVLEDVAGEIRDTWGPRLKHVDSAAIHEARLTIADAFVDDSSAADRFVSVATAFNAGDYPAALRLLIEHNGRVMKARDGQPWVLLTKGKLEVQYQDEAGQLIPGSDLPTAWRNTYFINSLYDVVTKLKAA